MTGFGVLGAGLLAGALHVYMGPDHLAALAVISLKAPARAWKLGVRWGLGHAGGVLLVAALAFSCRGLLEIDRVSHAGEMLVGMTLMALGIWGLLKSAPRQEAPAPPGHSHGRAAFLIGTLHGAAGTSHLLGVLPGLALPSAGLSLTYLGAFGLATILAMGLFAGVLGAVGRCSPDQGARRVTWMIRSASVCSILVGAAWIGLTVAGMSL